MDWINIKAYLTDSFRVDKRLLLVYVVIYGTFGVLMNAFGIWAEIAKFKSWFQIISTYLIYMIPISLMLRKLPWHAQYAYGLIAMAVLEFLGYALQTSYAYPNNLLDQFFNIRNFSLSMALFFASYFPLGNALVKTVAIHLFNDPKVVE